METIELWPFSQGEIDGRLDQFAERVFTLANDPLPTLTPISRAEVAARLVRGGFPGAVLRTDERRRARLLASYVADLINRDIRELSDIGRGDELRRMLRLVAARTGQLLVAEQLANELSVTGRTVSRYLELCEEIFLIKRIPAWSSNLARRVISSPKVAFADSGIAAYLLGQSTARLSDLTSQAIGPLLEGFVTMELARQLTWASEEIRLFHYRTKDKVEVDAILENQRRTHRRHRSQGVEHRHREGFQRPSPPPNPGRRRVHRRCSSLSGQRVPELRTTPEGSPTYCLVGVVTRHLRQ